MMTMAASWAMVSRGTSRRMMEENHGTECSKCSHEYAQRDEHGFGHSLTAVEVGQTLVPGKEEEGEHTWCSQQYDKIVGQEL